MKKLLLIIGIPVLLVVLAIAALLFLVDPNQFKPLVVEQTKKQTGMDLVVEGDIEWQIFPSLGLSLGKTELKNPEGYKNENLLKIDGISADVSVMPLMSKELEIGNVTLDGAEIYLETRNDGSSNLDGLTGTPETSQGNGAADSTAVQSESAPSEAQEPSQEWTINLAGISVTNALLEIQDDASGSYTKLYDVGLTVSEFAFDKWASVTFEAKGKNNQQNFAAKGNADLKLSQDLSAYELRNILLDSSFNDPTTDITSAKVELPAFQFDKASPLTLAVQGKAADMDIALNLSSSLLVDRAVSVVKLQGMKLDSEFKEAALPQSPMKVIADTDFGFDLAQSLISLDIRSLVLNDIKLDGSTTVKLTEIPQIRLDLHSPEINLDALLGLNNTSDSATATTESSKTDTGKDTSAPENSEPEAKAPQKEVEPDLTAFKTLDIKGKMAIDKFTANNVRMQNVVANFTVNRGVADLTSFTSDLYQGSIKATGQLDARKVPATYWAKKQISGVKVQPLMIDAAQNDMLEGTGNINVDVKGKSLTPSGIKQNLSGTVDINFADGAVNGINVAQLVRVNYAKLKGQQVDASLSEEKKTDFSAMKATLKLTQGVVSTQNLNLSSPLLRVHGKGEANYIKETMDFMLDTSIVGTLKGQGGKEIDDLKDITIPVRVYNRWLDPKYKIEFDQLLKALEQEKKKELEAKAEKELDRFLGDKVKDEKTKELADKLLKGLFN